MGIEIKNMTLRDWLAGQALSGLVSNPELMVAVKELASTTVAETDVSARVCYEYADAMLKARRE